VYGVWARPFFAYFMVAIKVYLVAGHATQKTHQKSPKRRRHQPQEQDVKVPKKGELDGEGAWQDLGIHLGGGMWEVSRVKAIK